MAVMSRSARFDDPIPLPNDRKLFTLKDAGYIALASNAPVRSNP
jgi:hypothetical protein